MEEKFPKRINVFILSNYYFTKPGSKIEDVVVAGKGSFCISHSEASSELKVNGLYTIHVLEEVAAGK